MMEPHLLDRKPHVSSQHVGVLLQCAIWLTCEQTPFNMGQPSPAMVIVVLKGSLFPHEILPHGKKGDSGS